MASNMTKNVKLISGDGETFEVDIKIANYSGKISKMLEEGKDAVVTLPRVLPSILRKVLEILDVSHSKENDGTPPTASGGNVEWEASFFDEDQDTLIQLLHVAHLLEIHVVCNQDDTGIRLGFEALDA
ncbi:hypothetical protein KR018_005788 [Drosophila ironensis]|nr:hypothetical protein KR018_005788 [Drosophila ironensis]